MDGVETLRLALEQMFEQIHRHRMWGLPVLNPRLQVQVVGLRRWRGDWLGVLVTPWVMSLIALPRRDRVHEIGAVGSGRVRDFPSGAYEFIAGDQPGIGPYETCSLFSPMHVFSDQEAAVATAWEVMALLIKPATGTGPAPQRNPLQPREDPDPLFERRISRRELLRSALGNPT